MQHFFFCVLQCLKLTCILQVNKTLNNLIPNKFVSLILQQIKKPSSDCNLSKKCSLSVSRCFEVRIKNVLFQQKQQMTFPFITWKACSIFRSIICTKQKINIHLLNNNNKKNMAKQSKKKKKEKEKNPTIPSKNCL